MPPQVVAAAPTGVRAPVPCGQLCTSPACAERRHEPFSAQGQGRRQFPPSPPRGTEPRQRAAPPQAASAAPRAGAPGRAVPPPRPQPQPQPPRRVPPRGTCAARAGGQRERRVRTARPLAATAAVTSCPSAHPAPGSAAAALAGQGRIKFCSGRGKPAVRSQVGACPRRPPAAPSSSRRRRLAPAVTCRPPAPPRPASRVAGRRARPVAAPPVPQEAPGPAAAGCRGRGFPHAPAGAEGRGPGGAAAGGGPGGGDGARRGSGAAGAAR